MLAMASETRFWDPFNCSERPEEHEKIIIRLISLLCTNEGWDELHTHDMIQTLRSFSLISTTSVEDSVFLHLHPLVQAWARDKVLSTGQDYHAMAAQTLSACYFEDNTRLYRHLAPHIGEMLYAINGYSLHANEKMGFAQVLFQLGYYRSAEVQFSEILRWLEDTPKEVTKDTLWITEWLATAIHSQGRWNEVEKLEEVILEKRRVTLGKQHPDTIRTAENLASVYRAQRRWSEVEKLELDVLEQREVIFGKQHPETLRAVGNLACIYRRQGRLSEAEKLEVEALEQWKTIAGTEHPDPCSSEPGNRLSNPRQDGECCFSNCTCNRVQY